MRVHAWAAPRGFPAGRAYIAVGGRVASNFTITVRVGSLAPLTPTVDGAADAEAAPCAGRIVFGRSYSGRAAAGAWVYFRLSVTADDISKNRAVSGTAGRAPRKSESLFPK